MGATLVHVLACLDAYYCFMPLPHPLSGRGYHPNLIQNALVTLKQKDAFKPLGNDRYAVFRPRSPSRPAIVSRHGDQWTCNEDRSNTQDNPCGHIFVVLLKLHLVDLPNSAASVVRKTDSPRNHALETKAWELVPLRLPALLAKLLRQTLHVIASDPKPNPKGGEPVAPLYPQVYQAVMRVAFRKSLRCGRGELRSPDHLQHNPYGPVGIATLSRFLRRNRELLEKLLALTLGPVRPYETLIHPDGTGLTEQHFSPYFDEAHKKYHEREDGEPWDGPREHNWNFAEILWTYRYTMVGSIYSQQGPFNETRWFIPLMNRARLMLDSAKSFGGDKAYDANYIFQYAHENGMEANVKIREGPIPSYSDESVRFRKAKMIESLLDKGYAVKANRRNNAETGNHAIKAILGDQLFSKTPETQRSELLCMCIAYNLTRLVYFECEQGFEADFQAGLDRLLSRQWVSLETLRADFDLQHPPDQASPKPPKPKSSVPRGGEPVPRGTP